MINIAKKKGFMDKISELIASYEEDEDDEEENDDLEEEEIEEYDESFIIRMTKSYNYLVDSIEFMPVSSSREFKFKKDQMRAKSFFLKITNLAKDYHDFLNRMKQVVGA